MDTNSGLEYFELDLAAAELIDFERELRERRGLDRLLEDLSRLG